MIFSGRKRNKQVAKLAKAQRKQVETETRDMRRDQQRERAAEARRSPASVPGARRGVSWPAELRPEHVGGHQRGLAPALVTA
jgi:hypothetical protein